MTKIIDISLFLLIAGFVTATSCLDFDPESEATLFANHTEAWAAHTASAPWPFLPAA